MIHRLAPTIPLLTPKGAASAHLVIDYGEEHHLLWVCFIDATGECWTFRNSEVKLAPNETMRPKPHLTLEEYRRALGLPPYKSQETQSSSTSLRDSFQTGLRRAYPDHEA